MRCVLHRKSRIFHVFFFNNKFVFLPHPRAEMTFLVSDMHVCFSQQKHRSSF